MIRGGCLSGECYDFAMGRLEWRVQYDLKDDSTLGDAMRLWRPSQPLTSASIPATSSPSSPGKRPNHASGGPQVKPRFGQPLPAREAGAAAICATALRTTFAFDHLARCSAS